MNAKRLSLYLFIDNNWYDIHDICIISRHAVVKLKQASEETDFAEQMDSTLYGKIGHKEYV